MADQLYINIKKQPDGGWSALLLPSTTARGGDVREVTGWTTLVDMVNAYPGALTVWDTDDPGEYGEFVDRFGKSPVPPGG